MHEVLEQQPALRVSSKALAPVASPNAAHALSVLGPAGRGRRPPAPRDVLHLQRLYGNRAVTSLLHGGPPNARHDNDEHHGPDQLMPHAARQLPAVQRRAKTAEEQAGDLQQHRSRVTSLKQEVINPLSDKAWPKALQGFEKLGVTYSESGAWGGTSLAKRFRGTSNLDPLRVRAKALGPLKDSKPAGVVMDNVKTIADETGRSVRNDSLTEENSENHKHIVAMVEKIAYYLVNDLPAPIRKFAQHLGAVDVDVSGPLGGGGGSQGAVGVKSEKVKSDETAIRDSISTGTTDTRGFHGSASWLLEGLGKSGGKLLSQKSAFNAGLLKTGEGTTFSSGKDLKSNVYIGKGDMGFGLGASYALAPAALTSYNVSLFSDLQLASEVENHRKILQLEELMSKLHPEVAGSAKHITMEKVKKAATDSGLDVSDPGFAHMFKWQGMVQLEEMLGKLMKEQEDRAAWDKDDPRRQGGHGNPDNYPILLEFGLGGLTATDDPGGQSRVTKGDYRLAGEATVKDEIDLGSGRLKVVYCPEAFIAKTTLKLKGVFGDTHNVEVRALEAIKGGLTKDSAGEKTLRATYGQLEKQQKSLDVKMKGHGDLARNLEMPDKVYGGKDGNQELTKIHVRGRATYVDETNKPVLHQTIVDMMSEGVAPAKSPEALLTMGGPGAGKSSILAGLIADQSKYVTVNSDDVKESLPQYQAGVKAGDRKIASKVHEESKTVAKSLQQKAITNHSNLIYDATGAAKKDYDDLITKLEQQNYRIKLVMVHVEVEEGLRRVRARAEETGRDVPEGNVKAMYPRIGPNFLALVPKSDQALLYSNMGKTPQLLWDSSKTPDVSVAKDLLGIK